MEYDKEQAKKSIEKLFGSFGFDESKSEKKIENDLKPFTDANLEDESIVEFAKEKALEEIELIREAFLEFQDKTRDTVIFNYMIPFVQDIAEFGISLSKAIQEDMDESKLSPENLKKYRSVKKVRAQILANIYNKYGKED